MIECLLIFWCISNIIAVFLILINCLDKAEFDLTSIFLYPILVSDLRKNLNIAGTSIVIAMFSIYFLPAIILYFVGLGILTLGYIVGTAFIKLFERKD